MRVIAGTAKGRKLAVPAGRATRPTPGRVRESVFSMLAGAFAQARVLDLFAGSGALGIEALSRGAAHATFVESGRAALACLHKHLASFVAKSRILPVPCHQALGHLADQQDRFDLVFVDPPYRQGLVPTVLEQLVRHELLAAGALVYCEHGAHDPAPSAVPPLTAVRRRCFGEVCLALFAFPEPLRP